MVHQGAARRFGNARAFLPIHACPGADVLVEDAVVAEQLLDRLDAVQNLNQARVVVVE